jgi:hypothetical protein
VTSAVAASAAAAAAATAQRIFMTASLMARAS